MTGFSKSRKPSSAVHLIVGFKGKLQVILSKYKCVILSHTSTDKLNVTYLHDLDLKARSHNTKAPNLTVRKPGV